MTGKRGRIKRIRKNMKREKIGIIEGKMKMKRGRRKKKNFKSNCEKFEGHEET